MIRSREALCKHLEKGGRVRCDVLHDPQPKTIWTTDTGETIHGAAMKWALAEGKVRGASGGLFPGLDQTFEAA